MRLTLLSRYPEVEVGLSSVADGTMALRTDVGQANRRKFFQRAGIDPARVINAGLNHGTNIRWVVPTDGGQTKRQTDGLMTCAPNLALGASAADCMLVFAYNPAIPLIAIVHAGWRGLAAKILLQMVAMAKNISASSIGDMAVGIGPSICGRHYEFSKKKAEIFGGYHGAVQKHEGRTCVDLRLVAWQQLRTAGIRPDWIETDPRCTFEDLKLFSYRRKRLQVSGSKQPLLHAGYILRTTA